MKVMSLLIAGIVVLNGVVAMAQTETPAAAPVIAAPEVTTPAVEKAAPAKGCCGTCSVKKDDAKTEKTEAVTNECTVLCEKLNLTDEQKEKVKEACKECKKAKDVKEATANCMKAMETILTEDQMKILKEAVEKNEGVCPMAKACMEDKEGCKTQCATTPAAPADVVPVAVPEAPAAPAVSVDPTAPENK